MIKILSTIRTAKAQRFENLISTGGNKKLPRPKLATTRGEKPRIIRLVVTHTLISYPHWWTEVERPKRHVWSPNLYPNTF